MADAIKILLEGKSVEERASIKGSEIAKIGQLPRKSAGDFDIEIVSINPIDKGVEVFARVWDSNGQQVGFGRDGSVDIERFVIINPPVLVPDGTKTVVVDSVGQEKEVDNYKEDLEEAILLWISRGIATSPDKHGPDNIVPEKVGHSTYLLNPASGTGGGTACRVVANANGAGLSWNTIHDAAAGSAVEAGVNTRLLNDTTAGEWTRLERVFLSFPTEVIPDSATILSATLSIVGTSKENAHGINPTINVVSSTFADVDDPVVGDYDLYGTTVFSTAITYAGFNASGTNSFVLNASGLAHISKTAPTKFAIMEATYDIPDATPTWSNPGYNSISGFTAYSPEESGTTNDPLLTVVDDSVDPPNGNMFLVF